MPEHKPVIPVAVPQAPAPAVPNTEVKPKPAPHPSQAKAAPKVQESPSPVAPQKPQQATQPQKPPVASKTQPSASTPPVSPAPSIQQDLPTVVEPHLANARPSGLMAFWLHFSPVGRVLLVVIPLPTLLSLIYFGLVASPMYVAEARFAVRGAEGLPDFGGLAAMFLPAGTSVGTDTHIVAEYIRSPDIMDAIDAELGIFRHFADSAHDFVSRLAADATRDDRLSYWQWAVQPSFDPETGIIALTVKAYDPIMAKKLADAVLARSEALVNAMSSRSQEDAITLAIREVKTAEDRVSKAQEAMREFRNRSGMLDPSSTAGGLQGIVSQLEGEAVRVRAEIAEAATYMSQGAPALVGLRARLRAVENQLASEKLRLAGEARPDNLTSFAGEYEELLTESEFARQQLVSAMTSLETARIKAEAKSRYVVAFQLPVEPDESLYPRPWLFSFWVLAGSLVLAGLVSLIVAAVREHAGF